MKQSSPHSAGGISGRGPMPVNQDCIDQQLGAGGNRQMDVLLFARWTFI